MDRDAGLLTGARCSLHPEKDGNILLGVQGGSPTRWYGARQGEPAGRGRRTRVLELLGLTRRYGEVVALDDLSFTVREGQMFGFVGPNGAGKTTTMRIVLGVLEADRGEVRWRGRPVDAETRRRFGYMPEDSG
jgi:ABC-type multidrug transport system fused ATPase/permease subunit